MDSRAPLGTISVESFLADHWQKKPLLIRQAFPDFESPLSAEDLAGLACEEGVETRLVLGGKDPGDWQVRLGPFEPEEFMGLGPTHWTLLVQEVDRVALEVSQLLERFRFMPNWRIDDVMMSYAAPEGSVGPHVDNYDVFLLQGAGRRRWRIENRPLVEYQSLPNLEIDVLADFDPDEEWLLEPGDMLYLPPRIAHHGIAIDPCLTYSIGFRAPAQQELLVGFLHHLATNLDSNSFYRDPGMTRPRHPGEIDGEALERFREIFRSKVDDPDLFERWLGCFLTEPRSEHSVTQPEELVDPEGLSRLIGSGAGLERSAPSHFSFIERDDAMLLLFVGGSVHELGARHREIGELLCGLEGLTAERLGAICTDPSSLKLLTDLVNEGFLIASE